jgi:hypothetical protein
MPDRSTWSEGTEPMSRLPASLYWELAQGIMVRRDRRDVWWATPS